VSVSRNVLIGHLYVYKFSFHHLCVKLWKALHVGSYYDVFSLVHECNHEQAHSS